MFVRPLTLPYSDLSTKNPQILPFPALTDRTIFVVKDYKNLNSKIMKKTKNLLLSLPVLLLLTLSTARAQSRVGIVGGINQATIVMQPAETFDYKTGMNVGLFYDRLVGSYVAINITGVYSERGGYYPDGDAEFSLDYVENDLRFKILVGDGDVQPYLMAGPKLGYLISASGKVRSSNGYENVSELFQEFDLGFSAGLGIRFGPLFVEAVYSSSLMNAATNQSIEVLNKGFQLNGGISVPIGY